MPTITLKNDVNTGFMLDDNIRSCWVIIYTMKKNQSDERDNNQECILGPERK